MALFPRTFRRNPTKWQPASVRSSAVFLQAEQLGESKAPDPSLSLQVTPRNSEGSHSSRLLISWEGSEVDLLN